ncbi:MAG: hypothetical protein CMJ81_23820 [Planctomycetaceae bacterium]|nr:hypothetical protein [Planctomycetaceae bacterium]
MSFRIPAGQKQSPAAGTSKRFSGNIVPAGIEYNSKIDVGGDAIPYHLLSVEIKSQTDLWTSFNTNFASLC